MLQTPFLKLRDAVAGIIGNFAAMFISGGTWDVREDLMRFGDIPVLFVHGKKDELIPPEGTEQLVVDCVSKRKMFHLAPNATNEFPGSCHAQDLFKPLRSFLDQFAPSVTPRLPPDLKPVAPLSAYVRVADVLDSNADGNVVPAWKKVLDDTGNVSRQFIDTCRPFLNQRPILSPLEIHTRETVYKHAQARTREFLVRTKDLMLRNNLLGQTGAPLQDVVSFVKRSWMLESPLVGIDLILKRPTSESEVDDSGGQDEVCEIVAMAIGAMVVTFNSEGELTTVSRTCAAFLDDPECILLPLYIPPMPDFSDITEWLLFSGADQNIDDEDLWLCAESVAYQFMFRYGQTHDRPDFAMLGQQGFFDGWWQVCTVLFGGSWENFLDRLMYVDPGETYVANEGNDVHSSDGEQNDDGNIRYQQEDQRGERFLTPEMSAADGQVSADTSWGIDDQPHAHSNNGNRINLPVDLQQQVPYPAGATDGDMTGRKSISRPCSEADEAEGDHFEYRNSISKPRIDLPAGSSVGAVSSEGYVRRMSAGKRARAFRPAHVRAPYWSIDKCMEVVIQHADAIRNQAYPYYYSSAPRMRMGGESTPGGASLRSDSGTMQKGLGRMSGPVSPPGPASSRDTSSPRSRKSVRSQRSGSQERSRSVKSQRSDAGNGHSPDAEGRSRLEKKKIECFNFLCPILTHFELNFVRPCGLGKWPPRGWRSARPRHGVLSARASA